MKYTYCKVTVNGNTTPLYYIADLEDLGQDVHVGDVVKVPFGKHDDEVLGHVVEVNEFEKEDVPYPVEKTKEIIDVFSSKQCDESLAIDHTNFLAVEEYLRYKQQRSYCDIYYWCLEHDQPNNDSYLMKHVMEGYQILIDYDYKVGDAACNLGAIYYSGLIVEHDYKKAMEYYKIASDHGCVQALVNLGYCYYYGRVNEVDYENAYKCFNKAALLGNANALFKIGDMYLNGYYVEKDASIAFTLYTRATKEAEDDLYNDFTGDTEWRIGKCYLYGLGVEKDFDEAMNHLCNALPILYERRYEDPFVMHLIKYVKRLIQKCEERMLYEMELNSIEKLED